MFEDWRAAQDADSRWSYERFVREYMDFDPACAMIRSSLRRIESQAYDDACATHTVMAFEDYLSRFPDGVFTARAQSQRDNLRIFNGIRTAAVSTTVQYQIESNDGSRPLLGLQLPFADDIKVVLSHAGIEILPFEDASNADCHLILTAAVRSRPVEAVFPIRGALSRRIPGTDLIETPARRVLQYRWAHISGTLSLGKGPEEVWHRKFWGQFDRAHPGIQDSSGRIAPEDAPFEEAYFLSYMNCLAEMVHEYLGPDPLIAALRDPEENTRRKAAWMLAQMRTTRGDEALDTAYLAGDGAVIAGGYRQRFRAKHPDTVIRQLLPVIRERHDVMMAYFSFLRDPNLQGPIAQWETANGIFIDQDHVHEYTFWPAPTDISLEKRRLEVSPNLPGKALGNLADSRNSEAVPILLRALDSVPDYSRAKATAALLQITGEDLGDDVDGWREWWRARYADALSESPCIGLFILDDELQSSAERRAALARVAEIDASLEESRNGRTSGLVLLLGLVGWTAYDLTANGETISDKRKMWDWIGLGVGSAGLLGFVVEYFEDKKLKERRNALESKIRSNEE
jgi:hypothetical protein